MKKILILTAIILGTTLSASAMDIVMPPSVGGLQSPDSQMRLMEQQRFRQEEYNEFKDMKQQKEERNKKLNLQEKFDRQNQVKPVSQPQEVNLIRENGQLKLVPIKAE